MPFVSTGVKVFEEAERELLLGQFEANLPRSSFRFLNCGFIQVFI